MVLYRRQFAFDVLLKDKASGMNPNKVIAVIGPTSTTNIEIINPVMVGMNILEVIMFIVKNAVSHYWVPFLKQMNDFHI